MTKRFINRIVPFALLTLFASAANAQNAAHPTRSWSSQSRSSQSYSSQSWSGIVVSSACTIEEAANEAPDCSKETPGTKFSLYDENTRAMYSLDAQKVAAKHVGEAVTIRGALHGEIIKVVSLKPMSIGLAVGQRAPAFSIADQTGKRQTLATLRGTNGTVLLFFRSADWCPYCKGQLVALQNAAARFEKQGVKLAAISYDSEDILKVFSDKHKIDYPLLGDPQSKTIRAYGVLNPEATGMQKGMARPGYYFVDGKGMIREKVFAARFRDRLTGNSLLAKLFPELGEEVTQTVDTPQLQLKLEQSDKTGVPGARITLMAEMKLAPEMHVYAPGAEHYKTIALTLDAMKEIEFMPVVYPKSKILTLPAINETVPVFDGTFRLSQEAQVSTNPDFSGSLGKDGRALTITGKLDYQACDDQMCYLPKTIPVQWQLQVFPLDQERAPEQIRHK